METFEELYSAPLNESAPLLPPGEVELGDFAQAQWIWGSQGRRVGSQWAWFRYRWDCDDPEAECLIRLTADSRYRLYVNGKWSGDGPVRGWPQHWYYDQRNLSGRLKAGFNEIHVLVHYYGCPTFHIIPQRPGFVAELLQDGRVVAGTGASWDCAPAPEWLHSPDISIQMPPGEIFDARNLTEPVWQTVSVLGRVPWSGLQPRDVRETIIRPRTIDCLDVVRAVKLPKVRSIRLEALLHPNTVMEACHKSRAFALATVVEVEQDTTITWFRGDFDVYLDGRKQAGDSWRATKGRHYAVLLFRHYHSNEHAAVMGLPEGDGVVMKHPQKLEASIPWLILVDPDFVSFADDLHWMDTPPRDLRDKAEAWERKKQEWGGLSAEAGAFADLCREFAYPVELPALMTVDPDAEFKHRELGAELPLEREPGGSWIIAPSESPTELAFDLGGQAAGFHEIELTASAGCIIDVSIIEHIRPDGVRQHTTDNWNGFRYIAREGRQCYTTRTRRSGRHLFLTAHGTSAPVVIHSIRLKEEIFPVSCKPEFSCSDETLSAIYLAAVRTMELSMADTFIDSLYEQTLWVGDARNEQLYALHAWDARDISVRSMRLAAQSLERLPMVGCQVPSCWEPIIPVWSFLWGQSVWEYYAYSGDQDVLREMWPSVLKNLRGAAAMLNEDSLFEAPWWNLFEWADSDFGHRIVLYNSMFFVGALQAAIQCAETLEENDAKPWLCTLEKRLKAGLRRQFDTDKGLFPEAIRRDGTPTERFSVHPQFLAVLYGIVDEVEGAQALLDSVADDTGGLVRMASPFAFQFYGEAFERLSRESQVIDRIRKWYKPMIEIGDTLWEALPGSLTSPEGFPTRSHCHGWSCAPMYFLPRILLGVKQERAGEPIFFCSPQPHGLSHARGSVQTGWGPIRISWKLQGRQCHLHAEAPEAITLKVVSNHYLDREDLEIITSTPARSRS